MSNGNPEGYKPLLVIISACVNGLHHGFLPKHFLKCHVIVTFPRLWLIGNAVVLT
jgi:hypothetical protein